MLTLTLPEARKLAISAQSLSEIAPTATLDTVRKTINTLRCLQLDPIRTVERPQHLVLWSRVGQYDQDWLTALHNERHIFEYWAHAASMVLTEDYPLYELKMRQHGKGKITAKSAKRYFDWIHASIDYQQYILSELDRNGPMLSTDFEHMIEVPWEKGVWSSGKSIGTMLDYLWTSGQIMVSKRDGLKRWWDLSERVLPDWTPAGGWTAEEVTYDAAPKAVRGLGVGRLPDIKKHFIEKRYVNLPTILKQLVAEEKLIPAEIKGLPDTWYVHPDHLTELESMRSGQWAGRTTLLSPFDHLIRDRDRTLLLWDFFYRIEIYVPKAKRQFGYYVLPILHGDRLIGRIDSKMDRKTGLYEVFNVYAEAHAEPKAKTDVLRSINALGRFLEAESVKINNLPPVWR